MRRVIYILSLLIAAHANLSAQTDSPATTTKCPTISVECSTEFDKTPTINVHLIGADSQAKLAFNWTLSRGTILSGQGTKSISIGDFGDGFTATIEVQGLPENCHNTASCTMIQCPAPLARIYDTYGDIDFSAEQARLDNLVIEMENDPGAQTYLIVYGIKPERQDRTEARLDRTKEYLIEQRQVDAGRVVTVYGGYRKAREVEVWIVPPGATPPTPTPTVK